MTTRDVALALIESMRAKIVKQAETYRRNNEYYDGAHPLKFASNEWRKYNSGRYSGFSDNWCSAVANAPAERLQVSGFQLDIDPQSNNAEKTLWDYWQRNELTVQSSQGFLETIVSGVSYVFVWGDRDGNPMVTWERADQVTTMADPETRQTTAALKVWVADGYEYATLWLPDEVWRLRRRQAKLESYGDVNADSRSAEFFRPEITQHASSVTGAYGPWQPRPGVEVVESNPLGEVPIVDVPNRPRLGRDPVSEIDGVIALQDAINMFWLYTLCAADFASLRARVIMGQEPPKMPILDNSGNVTGYVPINMEQFSRDRLLWLSGENTKIGEFTDADLSAFTSIVEMFIVHIAAQTRTPAHYLVLSKGMVNISVDTMRAAEVGLVKKCEEMQRYLSLAVRSVFRLIAKVVGDKTLADACRTGTPKWQDPENRSEAQLVDALTKLAAIGFPFEFIASRYGLSGSEIERLLSMRETDSRIDPLSQIARQIPDTSADDSTQ